MIDKKKTFVLSLQGWTYKGVLDKWFYGIADPLGPAPYHGFVSTDNPGVGTYIPGGMVVKKEGTEHILLFLDDHTYYELGIRDTTR